jgi:AcrR family transcriptional regulator
VDAAEQHGYRAITRHQVAKYANCSPALVSKYYISMDLLRNAVMAHAVRAENLRILAQGLADGNPLAVGASKALKHAALTRLA